MESVFIELLEVTKCLKTRSLGDINAEISPNFHYRQLYVDDEDYDLFLRCRSSIFYDGTYPTIDYRYEGGPEDFRRDLNIRREGGAILKWGADRAYEREQMKLWNAYDQIGALMDELEAAKQRILELELRPPEMGGCVYEEAKNDFEERM